MVTLQNISEEIKAFVQQHDLMRSDAFASEHQVGMQLALTRVTDQVLSTFGELADQPSGREVLWNTAREAAQGPGAHGVGLVKAALDDRYHGRVNSIAKAAGVQAASASKLLDVVAAAALEIMGGLVAEHHWSAQQLGQWLRPRPAASEAVAAPVPLAGFATESAAAAAVAGGASTWVAKHANALLLAVGVVAVGEFGYIIGTRSDAAAVVPAAANTSTAAEPAASGAGSRQYTAVPVANLSASPDANGAGLGKSAVPVVLKLKNGVRQIIGSNSTESKLYQFLIDPSKEVDIVDPTKGWIGFDRIYFESNKAVLTNESLWQLSNVASILKRFPAAKIKLGGYTDSSGNPVLNLKLSQERAKAAMTTLVSMGVPADHLQSAGYGALDNLASNDTEEGRSLNRRVSMQVVQK